MENVKIKSVPIFLNILSFAFFKDYLLKIIKIINKFYSNISDDQNFDVFQARLIKNSDTIPYTGDIPPQISFTKKLIVFSNNKQFNLSIQDSKLNFVKKQDKLKNRYNSIHDDQIVVSSQERKLSIINLNNFELYEIKRTGQYIYKNNNYQYQENDKRCIICYDEHLNINKKYESKLMNDIEGRQYCEDVFEDFLILCPSTESQSDIYIQDFKKGDIYPNKLVIEDKNFYRIPDSIKFGYKNKNIVINQKEYVRVQDVEPIYNGFDVTKCVEDKVLNISQSSKIIRCQNNFYYLIANSMQIQLLDRNKLDHSNRFKIHKFDQDVKYLSASKDGKLIVVVDKNLNIRTYLYE